jgi:uncharacterized membrane protein YuzA (DUF378 family)
MTKIDIAATVLVLIGALSWGLVGLFNLDIVDLFFENATVDRLVYLLIGTAGIFKIIYYITGRWKTRFVDYED